MTAEVAEAISTHILPHLLTVGGFLLAVFAIARLVGEKRQPSNTLAWLLGIVLVPYVGVPLYLLLGGRKVRRLAASKRSASLNLPGTRTVAATTATLPTVHAISSTGGSLPVGGNALRFITTGEHAYAELEAAILGARHSIHITTFILSRDDTGRRIVKLLAKRAREGVKVRLLLDALGCFMSSRGFVDPIRKAGGEVVKFMPVVPLSSRSSANLRNHRKIAIFDQHTAIIGGHNIAREYMGQQFWKKRWRDFGAVINGPGAAMLNQVFLADWSFASKQSITTLQNEFDPSSLRTKGQGELQIVASGPDVTGDPLYEGIVSMIQEAEQSIWIVTPYFIPDEVLLRSLIVKARAGKDVTLMLPAHSNHPVADYARRHFVRLLTQSGARVLLYNKGMMHSKAIIVDDRMALFGSANLDLRSLFVNFEIGVVIYSTPDVQAMRMWAGELMRECVVPKPEKPRRHRLLGNLAEDLSRLLAPLL